MYASVTSVALVGVEAREVRVEARVGRSERGGDSIVGLPDTAVREARDRVRAAIASTGYRSPGRFTVNLAPAEIPKMGTAYDLPIALALLAASGQLPATLDSTVAFGELGLDGSVLGSRGGVAAAIVADRLDKRCMVAQLAAPAAALVEGPTVIPVDSLATAVGVLTGVEDAAHPAPPASRETIEPSWPDLSAVRGHSMARRGLEIAAAGQHHLLLTGPPGSGKTLLASAAPSLLPPLEPHPARCVAQIYAAAGLDRDSWLDRPFRAPHHSATTAALLGGGSGMPVPGEVSLAHHGVLFLDELGEFQSHLLDGLRQPLEAGAVTIARKGISVTFPAEFQLIAATNPCPCGNLGSRGSACRCSKSHIDRYRRRLSGPLIDRFDIRMFVDRLPSAELLAGPGEASSQVRGRVQGVRRVQQARGFSAGAASRSELDRVAWSEDARRLLRASLDQGGLTARGYDRVRRVALTISDLDGSNEVGADGVAEAIALRARS